MGAARKGRGTSDIGPEPRPDAALRRRSARMRRSEQREGVIESSIRSVAGAVAGSAGAWAAFSWLAQGGSRQAADHVAFALLLAIAAGLLCMTAAPLECFMRRIRPLLRWATGDGVWDDDGDISEEEEAHAPRRPSGVNATGAARRVRARAATGPTRTDASARKSTPLRPKADADAVSTIELEPTKADADAVSTIELDLTKALTSRDYKEGDRAARDGDEEMSTTASTAADRDRRLEEVQDVVGEAEDEAVGEGEAEAADEARGKAAGSGDEAEWAPRPPPRPYEARGEVAGDGDEAQQGPPPPLEPYEAPFLSRRWCSESDMTALKEAWEASEAAGAQVKGEEVYKHDLSNTSLPMEPELRLGNIERPSQAHGSCAQGWGGPQQAQPPLVWMVSPCMFAVVDRSVYLNQQYFD